MFQIEIDGLAKCTNANPTPDSPILSLPLSKFLRKQGFVIRTDRKTGQTVGSWMAAFQPGTEYDELKEILKEMLVDLP